jgi:uncharacterized membrane protein (Fun14 family)
MDAGTMLTSLAPELGFGGVAGAVVGYASKKVTKLVALALGLVFIIIQGLVYLHVVTVDWHTVQTGAEHLWKDPHGVTLASRAWNILSANLPFGAAFAAGFGIGFKLG